MSQLPAHRARQDTEHRRQQGGLRTLLGVGETTGASGQAPPLAGHLTGPGLPMPAPEGGEEPSGLQPLAEQGSACWTAPERHSGKQNLGARQQQPG